MEGETFWATTNIKVAAACSAFGAKLRETDPVTRTIDEKGNQKVTFWFKSGSKSGNIRKEMESTWAEMKSGPEEAVRYVRAALENRETLLGLVKRAEPIRVIERGGQTLFIAENAKPETKKAILKHI